MNYAGDKAVSRRDQAFTLVELLVVIGIIALLVGLLLPALKRIRESSITVQCLSNQRQLGQAMSIYANSNNGIIPYTYETRPVAGPKTIQQFWFYFLAQDETVQWAVAGQFRKSGSTRMPPKPGEYGGTAIKCPNNAKWYGIGGFNGVSYAVMYYPTGKNGSFFVQYDPPDKVFTGCKLVQVTDPASTVLAIDSSTGGITVMGTYDNEIIPGVAVDQTGQLNRGGTVERVWLSHPNNTTNILFIDSHAETCDAGWLTQRSIIHYWDNDGVLH